MQKYTFLLHICMCFTLLYLVKPSENFFVNKSLLISLQWINKHAIIIMVERLLEGGRYVRIVLFHYRFDFKFAHRN